MKAQKIAGGGMDKVMQGFQGHVNLHLFHI